MKNIARPLSSIIRKTDILSNLAYSIVRPEPLLNTLTSRVPLGTNVYELDWDLLIILDTCRVDALREVSDEYEFLNSVDSIRSVGSSSREWVQKTFVEEYSDNISETLYITANPWVERVLEEEEYMDSGWPNWSTVSGSEVGHIDHAWKVRDDQSLAAHPEGTAAPELITDRAIGLGRELDFEQMIVHYVPPHHSYVSNALDGRPLKPHEKNPFEELRSGECIEIVWEAYLDELRWVLDYVEILLSNVDAPKAVISSDHGDAFGEYGLFMHDPALLDPNVKYVPWAETNAMDKQTKEVEEPPSPIPADLPIDTEKQLQAMGYL